MLEQLRTMVTMEVKLLLSSVYCDKGIQRYIHAYRLWSRRFASLLSYWNAKGSTTPLPPMEKGQERQLSSHSGTSNQKLNHCLPILNGGDRTKGLPYAIILKLAFYNYFITLWHVNTSIALNSNLD